MSLFKCDKCGCVENTAVSGYWNRGDDPALCSECDPQINKWHGIFKKRSASGMYIDRNGFLYGKPSDRKDSFGTIGVVE